MYKIWWKSKKRADVFLLLLFHKRHKNEKKKSKSQVRAGRLLLWQKNHFNIVTGVIVMGLLWLLIPALLNSGCQ